MPLGLNITEARVLAALGGVCLTWAAYLHGSWIEALGAAGALLNVLAGVSAYTKSTASTPTPPTGAIK